MEISKPTVADSSTPVASAVEQMRAREQQAGLNGLAGYRYFANHVAETKCGVLEFLISAKRAGKKVAGYGAPAKGNTLLNYCGIGTDMIGFTVDRNPHKQGMLLPGTHIPIVTKAQLDEHRPDVLVVFAYEYLDDIRKKTNNSYRYLMPIPPREVT